MRHKTRIRQQMSQEERQINVRASFAFLTLLLALIYICKVNDLSLSHLNFHMPTTHVQAQDVKIVSPLVKQSVKYVTPTVTPSPAPTVVSTNDNPSYTRIAAEIKRVFGPDTPKAMKLLSCENSSLNPSITNTNAGGSIDYGVFQINNYWQKINNEAFLKDYTINIRIAYNIYTRDGDTFKLWTCGKKLGI